MPTTSGFTSAPLTRLLLLSTISLAILTTILDSKHHFALDTNILTRLTWTKWLWRISVWWTTYTNSADVLFACLTIYQLRMIERIWGTRKFASLILSTTPYTSLLPPLFLYTLNLLSLNTITRIPSGPTALLFALLAQYHAAVPYTYRYRVSAPLPSSSTATSSSQRTQDARANGNDDNETENDVGIILTSKSLSYLPALQLALSSLPGSLVPAIIGWSVGYAWRYEILPWPRTSTWRIGSRVWRLLGGGARIAGANARVEGLRRRMSVEAGEGRDGGGRGAASGFSVESVLGARASGRRNS